MQTNNNITIIKINQSIFCKKNYGGRIMEGILFEGYEYYTTKFKIEKKRITFSLNDEKGWIGDYSILRSEFEEKCVIIFK